MSPTPPRRKQKSKPSPSTTGDSPRLPPRTTGMKVIQVGKNAQSRIAQACDRCRTKKIRCDGLRPTCSSCTAVGFECRTSDKLSRRAFPRGYTECLEDRVRELEEENRGFAEKIERIGAAASRVVGTTEKAQMVVEPEIRSTGVGLGMERLGNGDQGHKKLPKFMTAKPRLLLDSEVQDQFFMGMSSGRTFIELFCRKMQETVRANPSFNPTSFIQTPSLPVLTTKEVTSHYPTPYVSETLRPQMNRLVTLFFTKWASVFPVLHRGAFLPIYNVFQHTPERIKNPLKLAQVYLVLSLSGVATRGIERDDVRECEMMWQEYMKEAGNVQSMEGLQCLLLACIYSLMRRQHAQVGEYRALAVATAMRLGLHHSQRNFTFSAPVEQVRKKVFWTLFTVDCFAAASLGLPRLLNSNFCHCEFPLPIDDENITDQGIIPTLPDSPTRISTALSLYELSKLFAEILDYAFSVCDTEIDMEKLKRFDSELMAWEQRLPKDQRVGFQPVNDRPQFSGVLDGPPALTIIYYYLRTLLNRIILERNLSNWFNIAVDAIARYSRRIVILTGILEERNSGFTVPLAKTDLLALSGFAILLKGILQCPTGSKISPSNPPASIIHSAPLLSFISTTLFRYKAAGALDFAQAVSSFIRLEARPSNAAETGDVGGGARSEAGSAASSNDLASTLDNTRAAPRYIRRSVASESIPPLSNDGSAEEGSVAEQTEAPTLSGLLAVGPAGLTLGVPSKTSLFSGAGIMPTNPGDRGYELYSFLGTEGEGELGDGGQTNPVLTQDNDVQMGNIPMSYPTVAQQAIAKPDDVLSMIYGNHNPLTSMAGFNQVWPGRAMEMPSFGMGLEGLDGLDGVDPADLSLGTNQPNNLPEDLTGMNFPHS